MTADTKYRPLVLPLPRSDINLHLDGTFESLRIIDLQTFPTVEDEYELGDIIFVGLKACQHVGTVGGVAASMAAHILGYLGLPRVLDVEISPRGEHHKEMQRPMMGNFVVIR
ncbi:hypothetical protein B0H10DRAFT_1947446 [Mycena sp. CBHHK59/15]|nr:hypothetical protein B0H10DRAFT_1947446 [Mycena sp. CBHHK59/15]